MDGNSDNIALYAAVKTLHTDGNDMWSAVASLTLLAVTKTSTPEVVAKAFSEKYEITIPQDALKTVLSRLKKEGQINYTKAEVSLTEKGEKAQASLNGSVKNVKREYATLSEHFIKYLKKRETVTPKNVATAILDFIDDNIGFTSELITDQQSKSSKVPPSDVADFIVHLEKTNPTLLDLLQNIFFGRLYLSLIKTRTDLDKDAKFDRLVVYLDTNVLFSLLGLHDDEVSRSAKELLVLLHEQKESIGVAVFESTLDEARGVLNVYARNPNDYVEGMKVDSVHYRLRLKHIDHSDVLLLIENLRDKVEGLGIEVVKQPNLKKENVDKVIQGISAHAFVNDQLKYPKALDHDAEAYESIHVLRGNAKTRLLEKCKAVFVTQDRSVFLQAREESVENGSFPVAIRLVDIISLLWIKNLGTDDGTHRLLRNAVMGYARERLINHKLWDEFVQKLGKAQLKGDISKDDVGIILASEQTEKLLLTNSTKAVTKIFDPKYVSMLRAEQAQVALKADESAKRASSLETMLKEQRRSAKGLKVELDTDKIKMELLESRILKLSSIVAMVISAVLWLLILAVFVLGIIWALRSFGIDWVASIIAITAFVVAVILALVFGKSIKLTEFLINLRLRLYIFIRDSLARFISSRILGLE